MLYQDAYKCYTQGKLGNSDHIPVALIPWYTPISRHLLKTTVPVRKWTDTTTGKLLSAIETTEWSVLTVNGCDSSEKAEIISNYLAFCLDECVPTVSRVVSND